tara:strand:+ start:754 stop:924 length:171 start_codon:yes stop_codon:yes gene_type:complete
MEIRNLTDNPMDYLDAYCKVIVGHKHWEYYPLYIEDIDDFEDIHEIILIYKTEEEK